MPWTCSDHTKLLVAMCPRFLVLLACQDQDYVSEGGGGGGKYDDGMSQGRNLTKQPALCGI